MKGALGRSENAAVVVERSGVRSVRRCAALWPGGEKKGPVDSGAKWSAGVGREYHCSNRAPMETMLDRVTGTMKHCGSSPSRTVICEWLLFQSGVLLYCDVRSTSRGCAAAVAGAGDFSGGDTHAPDKAGVECLIRWRRERYSPCSKVR